MAPYLTTDHARQVRGHAPAGAGGIPTYVAVDPSQAARLGARAAQAARRWSAFLQHLYGPYPFRRVGAIVDNAPDVGYALETQTKPVFDRAPDELDARSTSSRTSGSATRSPSRQWPDIWLHEGFATWSEWIWTEQHGGQTAAAAVRRAGYATPASDERLLEPAARRPGRRGEPVRRLGLRPRRDDAAGAAREDRRPRLLHHPAPLVRRAPVRQRLHAGVHRAGGAGLAAEPRAVLQGVALHAGQARFLPTTAPPRRRGWPLPRAEAVARRASRTFRVRTPRTSVSRDHREPEQRAAAVTTRR